jgi:transposase-like protein
LPWEVTVPVLERERLIRAYATGRYTLTELAEAFAVARKTASKWVYRACEEGPAGLLDRSRAPHHHPNATPDAVVAAVLRKKEAHPTWGPLKLLPGPEDPVEVHENWPAPSTRALILSRCRLHSATPAQAASPTLQSALQQLPGAERGLVCRLQGLVPYRGWRALRPTHRHGRLQPHAPVLSGSTTAGLRSRPESLRIDLR